MKFTHSIIIIIALVATLSGCASLGKPAVTLLNNDLARTQELAEKYQRPEVAACVAALRQSVEGTSELINEETAGLISRAFRLALLKFQAERAKEFFVENCGGVAASVLIEVGQMVGGIR